MENKCFECKYGKRLNSANEYYCDYLEIVGHKRPVKADECKIYMENPKENKCINNK